MNDEVMVDDKKGKRMYKAPENTEESKQALKGLPGRTFAKLKGKGLTIIESWFEEGDSRLQPSKSLYNSMIADICNQIAKEVNDALVHL